MQKEEKKLLLLSACEQIGVSLGDDQIEKILIYMDELKLSNKKTNLIGTDDDKEVILKHIVDSLTCHKIITKNKPKKLVDVGTGGGLPGIVLKILFPEVEVSFLESSKKKCDFIFSMLKKLSLSEAKLLHGRAEELGKDEELRESFDVAISRAVAPLNVLAEYCLPFVRIDGVFIAMKGPGLLKELNEWKEVLNLLGGTKHKVEDIELPVIGDKRMILTVSKTEAISDKYPRRTGIPKKRPIF